MRRKQLKCNFIKNVKIMSIGVRLLKMSYGN